MLLLLAVIGWITGATDFNSDLLATTNALQSVIDIINFPFLLLGSLFGVDWLETFFEWFPIGWISKALGAIGGIL